MFISNKLQSNSTYYYLETRKLLFKKAPMHSNQQLAALHEHFCAKLLSNCKEFDPEIFFLHYYTTFGRLAFTDMRIAPACSLFFAFWEELYQFYDASLGKMTKNQHDWPLCVNSLYYSSAPECSNILITFFVSKVIKIFDVQKVCFVIHSSRQKQTDSSLTRKNYTAYLLLNQPFSQSLRTAQWAWKWCYCMLRNQCIQTCTLLCQSSLKHETDELFFISGTNALKINWHP